MKWYHYLLLFLGGIFLMNVVPHFVNGVSGNPFPTPFADPPGEGLSSPKLNVLWAAINTVVGIVLVHFGKLKSAPFVGKLIFGAGALLMAFYLAHHFGGVLN